MTAWLRRATDSDIWWSFKSSSLTVVAAAATLFIVVVAFLSPLLAPPGTSVMPSCFASPRAKCSARINRLDFT